MNFIEIVAEKFRARALEQWGRRSASASVRATYLDILFIKIIKENDIHITKGTYIDLGCGTGINSISFSKNFSQIFLLDISPRNIMYAKQTFKGVNIPVYFVIADAQKLPFKDESFEAASAFALIEHLPDQQTFLREVDRILTKNGIFILQSPGSFYSLIDPHTGILFPQVIPKKLKDWYVKKFFPKKKTYDIWNLDQRKAFKICKYFFQNIYLGKVNYPEIVAWSSIRYLYKFFKKIGLLSLCPLSYLFVCVKKPKNHKKVKSSCLDCLNAW